MGDSSRPLGRVLAYAAGVLVAAAGWAALVRLAISLGRSARDSGQVMDWTWTVLATLGATACLVLALLLFTRGWAARAEPGDGQPTRRGPRRHRRK
jgi:hypothetical protein